MRNYIDLLKMNFRQFLNSMNKKFASTYTNILLAILIVVSFGGLSVYFNRMIYVSLEVTSNLDYYIPAMASLSTMIIIVTSITKVKGSIYGNKDYGLLKTLPIKNSSIIAYKTTSIYISELKFSLIIMLPGIGILLYYDTATILNISYLVMAVLFIPILPILLFGIIGLLFSLVFERMKYSSIITTILSLGFVVAIYLMIYVPKTDQAVAGLYSNLFEGLKFVNPSLKCLKYAFDGRSVPLIIFVSANLLLVILFVLLTALSYDRINRSIESRTYKKSLNYSYKTSDVSKSLFKNEIRRICSSSNVLINVMMGPVMSVLMIVIMYLSFSRVEGGMDVLEKIAPVFVCFGLLMFGISPYSSFSVSLEGEAFWIIKTIPVNPKDIFRQKIIVSIIFTAPFAVIAAIVSIFLYKLSIPIGILSVVIYVVYDIVACIIGLIFNLAKANIHYKNEIEAIKKGSSSLKMMFASSLFISAFIGIAIGLGMFVNMILAFSLILVATIASLFVAIAILNAAGEKYFYNIY